MGDIKVTLLGTNGWYDTGTGNTISTLIETEKCCIVLDAGYGLHKLDRYMGEVKPVYCFISHFHLDHIVGLHVLPKFSRLESFTIITQDGGREVLDKLQDSPFTLPAGRLPFKFEIIEADEKPDELPFSLDMMPLLHSDTTLGARIGIDGKIIAYCPDTGYCDNAVELARGARLLLTECAYPPGFTRKEWPHLNPETAARIAVEAQVDELVLVHFDAYNYQDIQSRLRAQEVAQKIFPKTTAGMDDMEFIL